MPGFADDEIRTAEGAAGFLFPEELKAYLKYFGNGFRQTDRMIDTQVMFEFSLLPFATSMILRERYAHTIVLGEDLFADPTSATAFPIMTSGAEFISLVWTETAYAVVWKVNDYGYASGLWSSLEVLFEYVLDCWRAGIYKLDFVGDEIVGDYAAAMELIPKYGKWVDGDD